MEKCGPMLLTTVLPALQLSDRLLTFSPLLSVKIVWLLLVLPLALIFQFSVTRLDDRLNRYECDLLEASPLKLPLPLRRNTHLFQGSFFRALADAAPVITGGRYVTSRSRAAAVDAA